MDSPGTSPYSWSALVCTAHTCPLADAKIWHQDQKPKGNHRTAATATCWRRQVFCRENSHWKYRRCQCAAVEKNADTGGSRNSTKALSKSLRIYMEHKKTPAKLSGLILLDP